MKASSIIPLIYQFKKNNPLSFLGLGEIFIYKGERKMKKTIIGIILFIIILITGTFYACSKTEKAILDEVVTSIATETEIVTTSLTTTKTTKVTTTTSESTIETTSEVSRDVIETHNVPPALSSLVIETEIVVPVTAPIKVIETTIITNPPNPPETQTINDMAAAVGYRPIDKLTVELQNHIYNLCVENGVEFAIVMAIIEKESGFNASASNGVCIGLMQLHSRYNAGDLYDPYHNTTLGIQLIGRLVSTYGLSQGLVYYNCGEYSGVYAPTSYSNNIIAAAEKYR